MIGYCGDSVPPIEPSGVLSNSSATGKMIMIMLEERPRGIILLLYLGVEISQDLKWDTHIARITSSANKTIGFIQRNRNSCYKKN
jgi:hypothetical protein